MSAPLPVSLQGAWTRASIAIGDGPPAEEQQVLWLQGASAFADLRVPLSAGGDAGEASFAGTATFAAPNLTWHRDLDLSLEAHEDVGAVTFEDGDLVERGTFPFFGTPVAYAEVWRRLPTEGPVLALAAPRARLVRVGGHAITIVDERATGGAFNACHRALGPDGWELRAGLGPEHPLLPAPPPGEAWEVGDLVTLRGGGGPEAWTVVEAGVVPAGAGLPEGAEAEVAR